MNISLIGWKAHQDCRLVWRIWEAPWHLLHSRDWPPLARDSVRTRRQSTGNAGQPHRRTLRWARETRWEQTAAQQTCSRSSRRSWWPGQWLAWRSWKSWTRRWASNLPERSSECLRFCIFLLAVILWASLAKTHHGCTNSNTSKPHLRRSKYEAKLVMNYIQVCTRKIISHLCDRCVDDALVSILFPKASADL